jgi:hypothetical protein
MFLDDSPGAERAFRWAQRNLVDPKRDRRAPAAMRCASASHAAGAHMSSIAGCIWCPLRRRRPSPAMACPATWTWM